MHHIHEHKKVSFIKSMLIGFVHGLAGSGAMILLTMSTVKSVWEAVMYILHIWCRNGYRYAFFYDDYWHSVCVK